MVDLVGRDTYESQITRFLSREMTRFQKQLVNDLIAGNITSVQLNDPIFWQNLTENLEGWLRNKLIDVYKDAADQFLGNISYGLDPLLLDAAAEGWATDRAFLLVQQINGTSTRRLQAVIQQFFDGSMTNRQLTDRVAQIFGGTRAENIAVTEVTRAASVGTEYVANQLRRDGIDITTIWQTLVDELVCPICGPRHNQPMGSNWFDFPPAHPRCRCFTTHEIVMETA